MTKDLALLVGPDQKWLSTTGFLDKIRRQPAQGDGIGLTPSSKYETARAHPRAVFVFGNVCPGHRHGERVNDQSRFTQPYAYVSTPNAEGTNRTAPLKFKLSIVYDVATAQFPKTLIVAMQQIHRFTRYSKYSRNTELTAAKNFSYDQLICAT
jgi:hypothetical protein